MASVYKINDDFYDDSFFLIALHSTLEDYAIAYGLNRVLKSNLKRAKVNFELAKNSSFPFYEWQDELNDRYWALVANHSTKKELVANTNDLFQNESTYSTPRLIPELKEVDYFLKIEDDESIDCEEIIKLLLGMPRIMAAYEVDADKLKSKNNLIF
ncbi:IPExxxVDY family protein [Maribacter thermophilus]|uniref:IPExxxVDY family protein n=1 Tax=Maribacter thermophilus TaxID=1197874 RepID=UPI0006411F24|nr:IPExxxVDY family protein [Maribacter thermophilus]